MLCMEGEQLEIRGDLGFWETVRVTESQKPLRPS